ncbi:MAG: hypothetical protein ACR2GL_02910 [Thermoleophilaceae bacterium]
MRFGKRSKQRDDREQDMPRERSSYPTTFTEGWTRRTLQSASPAEADKVLAKLRRDGWTEQQLADRVLPYMPPAAPSPAVASIPPEVSRAWLDEHLGGMEREEITRVVEELERQGWSTPDIGLVVMPHLLPKLPPEDAEAILAELGKLGLTDDEIAELRP